MFSLPVTEAEHVHLVELLLSVVSPVVVRRTGLTPDTPTAQHPLGSHDECAGRPERV